MTDHDSVLVLYLMKELLIHGFFPSILLNLLSLCNNYILIIFVIFQKNLVLGCPTSKTTIKVHGTVHQTHGTFHKTLPKISMQVIGTVCQTNGTIH